VYEEERAIIIREEKKGDLQGEEERGREIGCGATHPKTIRVLLLLLFHLVLLKV